MGYRELVKRFDLVRDYMRDFLIFGFKTREDFDQKSTRTYDNERRRIESWLGGLLRWEYRSSGKAVFLSLDASELSCNPLYRAWKSKSFTDNDITLHFFLLDLLSDGVPRHAEQAADELAEIYGECFELSTVRRKLKEYHKLGLLHVTKQGKRLLYKYSACTLDTLFPDKTNVSELLHFFGNMAPLSVVGNFLLGRSHSTDSMLRFKHYFIVNTLEDQILLTALQAIRKKQRLEITNVSGRNGTETICEVIPVKIMVSVRTGRRYLFARRIDESQLSTFRLDYIKVLTPLEAKPGDEQSYPLAKEQISRMWGAAFPGHQHTERLVMTIAVDEQKEPYVIQRLRREGRGGMVTRIEPGLWQYSNEVYDISDMMNWVKTFIGRIVSLQGDNQNAIDRFYEDVRRMNEMYGGE